MFAFRRSTVALLFLILAILCWQSTAQEKAHRLSSEDEKFLQSLLRAFLFDPKGAERVKVSLPWHSFWGETEQEKAGWLVKDKRGDRVYFTDGHSIPAPPKPKITRIDFLTQCRDAYRKKKDAADKTEIHRLARDLGEDSNLVIAPWLYRLGHKGWAATILLELAREKEDEVVDLRKTLANSAYLSLVHAFWTCRDSEALAHGERLLRLYPVEAQEHSQLGRILADLSRRKQRGSLGKAGPKQLQRDFVKWDTKKQVAFLIESLDQMNLLQSDLHSEIHEDYRTDALVKLGEAAVPALIDALEKDERLTRSMYYSGRFFEYANIVSTQEVVFGVLLSILRISQIDPRNADADRIADDEEGLRKIAATLRAYWKEFGALSFEERMMRVLNDARSSYPALREAALNLAIPEVNRGYGRLHMSWHDPGHAPQAPRAALMKFQRPTVAEAILSAMDRDLADHDFQNPGQPAGMMDERNDIEDGYLFSLIALGDRRIVAKLTQRAEKAIDVRPRRKWSLACFHLGNPKPLREFAEEFRKGKIHAPDAREFEGIVSYLGKVPLPEADRALYALADPEHPLHERAAREVLDDWHVGSPFLAHPYCLSILRKALNDKTLTGITVAVSNNVLEWTGDGGTRSMSLPALLKDPSKRKGKVLERGCDKAAETLSWLVVGVPEYYALLNDADDRIADMKKLLDHYQGKFRRLAGTEQAGLFSYTYGTHLVPNVRPLGRPATPDDVKAGKAIFHLNGNGKLADVTLPALGTWKRAAKVEEARRCLIVQAEVGPDGGIVYGIIEPHAIRAVRAGELAKVTPLPKVVQAEE